MKRIVLACALVALALPRLAHAQTTTVAVTYATGWNMVGGPPGTDFSSASSLWQWQNGAYSVPAGSKTQLCQGYWALFNAPTILVLPVSTVTGSLTCALQAGWNMVGNPFAATATLPAGTISYYWNTSTQSYTTATSIPIGGAVWIHTTAAGTTTLQSTGGTTPPPTTTPTATVTISSLTATGPYQVHVGNTIEVLLPANPGYRVQSTSPFLRLQSAGYLADLTCQGSCETNITSQFWIFQATAPGSGALAVSPACTLATPPCAAPTILIQFTILP